MSSELETLSHFQGRAREKQAFDTLLQREGKSILLFTGVSGIGKTTLLNWLIEKRCRPAHIPYVKIDFDRDRIDFKTYLDYTYFLEKVFQDLFPDTYLPLQHKKRYEAQLRQIDDDLREQLSRQPIYLQLQYHVSGSSQAMESTDASLEAMAVDDKVKAFLGHFGEDLLRQPLIFFWDTFENVQEEGARWIFRFQDRLRDAGVKLKVVIAMREVGRLEMLRAESHLQLSNLSEEDSNALFVQEGVSDTTYSQKIYQEISQGHPLSTRFAIDLWRAGQEAGKPVQISELPQTIYGSDEAITWLNQRILERLDSSFQRIIEWGMLLRFFNLDIINTLILGDEKPIGLRDFTRFCAFSFVEHNTNDQGWRFHSFMRKVMRKYMLEAQPSDYEKFSQKAYTYFIQKAENEDATIAQQNLIEALYHHFQYAPREALAEWDKHRQAAKRTLNNDLWETLIRLVNINDEIVLKDNSLRAYARLKTAHFYRQRGQLELAGAAYRDALDFYTNPLAPAEIRTSENARRARHGFAVLNIIKKNYQQAHKMIDELGGKESTDRSVLNILAILEENEGHRKEALEILKKALELGPEDIHLLNTRANFELTRGNIEAAEHFTQRALNVPGNEKHNTTLKTAIRLAFVRKDIDRAVMLYEQVANLTSGSAASLCCRAILEFKVGHEQNARKILDEARKFNKHYVSSILFHQAILEYPDEPELARTLFEESLKGEKENIKTLDRWARLEQQAGHIGRTATLFERIVNSIAAENPRSPDLIEPLLNCARLTGRSGKDAEAVAYFQRILDIDDKHASTYVYWSIHESRHQRYSKAEELLKKAMALNPGTHAIMFSLANAEGRRGDEEKKLGNYEEAQSHYDKAYHFLKQFIQLNKRYVPGLIRLAIIEQERKEYKEAEKYLRMAIQIDHNNETALYNYAIIASVQNHHELAIERFKTLLELDEPDLSPIVRLRTLRKWAEKEWVLKRYDEARTIYRQACDLDLDNVYTRFRWAQREHEIANENQVNILVKEALSVPSVDEPRWIIAWARVEQNYGNTHHARSLYDFGIASKPGSSLLDSYASFESYQKNFEHARQLYQRANASDPRNTVVLAHWAIMEYHSGQIVEAQKLFRQSLAIAPQYARDKVKTLFSWIRLEQRSRNYPLVAQLFAEIAEIEPENLEAIWMRGHLALKYGILHIAYDCFQRVLSSNPDHSKALIGMARIARKRGNRKEEEEFLERANRAASRIPALLYLHIQALVAMGRKDYEQARDLLDRILHKNAHYSPALLHSAYLERKQGNVARAGRELIRILQSNPEHVSALAALAALARERKDFKLALKYFTTILDIDDPFVLSQNRRIQILCQKAETLWHIGDEQEARDAFQQAYDLAPHNTYTLLRWARREREHQNTEKSNALIKKAIARGKGGNTLWIVLWAHEERIAGNPDGARNLLQYARAQIDQMLNAQPTSHTLMPRTVTPLVLLFSALLHKFHLSGLTATPAINDLNEQLNMIGDADKEICARRIRKMDFLLLKEFALLELHEQHYYRACNLFKQASMLCMPEAAFLADWATGEYKRKKLDDARVLFRKALTIDPLPTSEEIAILQRWARLEWKRGFYDRAAKLFAEIVLLEPTNKEALRSQALLAMKLGQKQERRRIRQKLLALNPAYAPIIDLWLTDETYHVKEETLSIWQLLPVEEQHCQVVPPGSAALAVLSTPLFLVQGSAILRFTRDLKYSELHRVVARCLLKLSPCTTEQIAELLLLRDTRMVENLLRPFLKNQNIVKNSDGFWIVQNKTPLQKIVVESAYAEQEKILPFVAEWKTNHFFPDTTAPQTWNGIEQGEQWENWPFELSEEERDNWVRKKLKGAKKRKINWRKFQYTHVRIYTLQVVVYQDENKQRQWVPMAPQAEVLRDLQKIAQTLDVEQQIARIL